MTLEWIKIMKMKMYKDVIVKNHIAKKNIVNVIMQVYNVQILADVKIAKMVILNSNQIKVILVTLKINQENKKNYKGNNKK